MLFINYKNVLLFKFTKSQFTIKRFKSNLSVLFYGSSSFSLPTLKCLHSNLYLPDNDHNKIINKLDICTTSHQNHVGHYSIANNLNLIKWPYDVPKNKYDIGIVVSFGKLIPKKSIDSCKHGILNIHASLLPKLRGAAPIHQAILQDYKETGITIMKIKPHKFDIGDIIMQEKISIDEHTKAIDLHDKLSNLGSLLLMKCLINLDEYENRSISQNEEEATYANKIKPSENKINWKEMDLNYIYKMYRAFDQFFPIYTKWIDGREMRLLKMINYNQMIEYQDELNKEFNCNQLTRAGTIKYSKHKKLIAIKCKDKWVCFKEISLKGRTKISSKQFHNGYLLKLFNQGKEIVLN